MHKSVMKRLAREEEIRKVAGTMPAWQVAEKFNVSEKNLQGLCSRAGISLAFYHKPYSYEDREYIIKARSEGVRVSEIAKRVGRSEGAVSALLSNMKIRAEAPEEEP